MLGSINNPKSVNYIKIKINNVTINPLKRLTFICIVKQEKNYENE